MSAGQWEESLHGQWRGCPSVGRAVEPVVDSLISPYVDSGLLAFTIEAHVAFSPFYGLILSPTEV